MRGIDNNDIDLGSNQFSHSFEIIAGRSDRGADAQAALTVFCGQGVFDLLRDVFNRDQSFEVLVPVDDKQLFDAMLVQNPLRFFERRADWNRHQIVFRHHLADRQVKTRFEAQIAIGQNTDEPSIFGDRARPKSCSAPST